MRCAKQDGFHKADVVKPLTEKLPRVIKAFKEKKKNEIYAVMGCQK